MEYIAMLECLMWREFVAKAEDAYHKDGDHRFIIGALRDEAIPRSIRRRIVEMFFQPRVLRTPEWDAFEQVVTLSTPPPILQFMECALHELPESRRKFLDASRTQQLYQVLSQA